MGRADPGVVADDLGVVPVNPGVVSVDPDAVSGDRGLVLGAVEVAGKARTQSPSHWSQELEATLDGGVMVLHTEAT